MAGGNTSSKSTSQTSRTSTRASSKQVKSSQSLNKSTTEPQDSTPKPQVSTQTLALELEMSSIYDSQDTPVSPGVVNTNNPRELKNLVSMLQTKVEMLTTKVDKLDSKVIFLHDELVKNQAALAISKMTSYNLRKELDKQEQYSRRNCIVFDGVPSKRSDSVNDQTTTAKAILTENFPADEEIVTSFDKAHPIGPIKEGKQSYIMRFNKHSIVRRIYNNRRSIKKGITVRPSLTKARSALLKTCQQTAVGIAQPNLFIAISKGT